MEQGEVRGIALAWASWKNNKLAWFTGPKSFAVGLLQSGFVRDKDLPNIPLISEFAEGKDAKSAAELIATSTLIGRSLALPPGAPSFLAEPLREAFWKTVNSPAFIADATKTKLLGVRWTDSRGRVQWFDPRMRQAQALVDAALADLKAGQQPKRARSKPYGCSVKYGRK